MKAIPIDELEAWLAEGDIKVHPKYNASLVFESEASHSRFWELPESTDELPAFFRCILGEMSDAQSITLWPKFGSWRALCEGLIKHSIDSPIHALVSTGDSCAIVFSSTDIDHLVILLSFTAEFAFSLADDLFLFPSDRTVFAELNHHLTLHISAKSKVRLQRVIESLASHGYPLPTELPDPTFKQPHWM